MALTLLALCDALAWQVHVSIKDQIEKIFTKIGSKLTYLELIIHGERGA